MRKKSVPIKWPTTSAAKAESEEEMMEDEEEKTKEEEMESEGETDTDAETTESWSPSEESSEDDEPGGPFGKEHFAIEKRNFSDEITSCLQDLGKDQTIDFDEEAKNALQTGVEDFMSNCIFREAEISANAHKRLVVKEEDIVFANNMYWDQQKKLGKK